MKIFTTIWLTSITTFAFTSIYILANQERINAPGELVEVCTSAGVMIFGLLIVATVSASIFRFRKVKRAK